MNNLNVDIEIFCGEKGVGKTTYVRKKWKKNILINCGNQADQVKTHGALFVALSHEYENVTNDYFDALKYLQIAFKEGYVVIIDEAEHIDKGFLETIINSAILYPGSKIVITFNLDYQKLKETSEVFRELSGWYIKPLEINTNYCASIKDFTSVINSRLPNATESLINELLETSNYNFSELNRLLFLVKDKQTDYTRLEEEVLMTYSSRLIEKNFSELPSDLVAILKKSSVIGEMFQSSILESPRGFCVEGVKTYLKKLEATNLFIQSYLHDDIYQFVSNRVHKGVLDSMSIEEKHQSQNILLKYYMSKISMEQFGNEKLDHLQQLKRLAYDLNDHQTIVFSNKNLFFQYLKIGDNVQAKKSLTDLLIFCRENMDDTSFYLFLSYYKIRLDTKLGCFEDASKEIEVLKKSFPSSNSLYLQYYYAKNLYNTGDVDNSYKETCRLVSALKGTSSKSVKNQPIYALTYSLFATIQNHLNIGDQGKYYYARALNHAYNNLEDKTIYFGILKKYDMYHDLKFSYNYLLDCISYYEAEGERYEAAEVYLNLATEIIFNDNSLSLEANKYIEKAVTIFSTIPNEKLAYAQCNQAVFNIIQNDDFPAALSLLNNSILVGLSDFTYMTLYLNISMCYLVLQGPESSNYKKAYDKFDHYNSKIKARKNPTQYEGIYKELVDVIELEHRECSSEVLEKVDGLLATSSSTFFQPILEDIKTRNSQNSQKKNRYTDNRVVYETFNKHKIFLAEFRFWE